MRNFSLLLPRIDVYLAEHADPPAAGVPSPETLHGVVFCAVPIVCRRVRVWVQRCGVV